MAGSFLVLGLIAVRGPYIAWRERREAARQAQVRAKHFFPIHLTTDASSYRRYALVTITLTIQDFLGQPLEVAEPPKVVVTRNGRYVETVGGVHRLTPRHDPQRRTYVCKWPVPWNAEPGRYVVETRFTMGDPDSWPWEMTEEEAKAAQAPSLPRRPGARRTARVAYCVARAPFEIVPRPIPKLPPGMCVATWEASPPAHGAVIRRPSGEEGDWRALFEWCEFIGADTLWMRGGLTRAGGVPLTMEQPFVQSDMDAMSEMAAEAHRRGLKFGAWAMAFDTLPNKPKHKPGLNAGKPPYQWAKEISRSTGRISDTSFVSLLDERRREHLAAFLRRMQQDPNIDYVGLDYVRTEPGYELTDYFAAEMPVSLPPNWDRLGQVERWRYVARGAEPPGCYERPDFYESWNWYRAHLTAEAIADIIQRAQLTKPLWVFALSWKHGVQHGQDPLMFTDAGASVLAQMLYQIHVEGFEHIIKDWRAYVRDGQVYVVAGDQVDNYWHQELGPEELYRRMVKAHLRFIKGGFTQGAFWHDISRAAVVGTLGPYPASEWALAGAAAFSRVRETWRVYPLQANLLAPTSATVGMPFEVRLDIKNTCDRIVRGVSVKPMVTAGVSFVDPRRQVRDIYPGDIISMPFAIRITGRNEARKNRFMVALQIEWRPGRHAPPVRDDLPRLITVMDYIQAR